MVEKESCCRCACTVVNRAGGQPRGGRRLSSAEKRGDPNTLGLFTGCGCRAPLVSTEAKVHAARPDPDRAPGIGMPAVIAVKRRAVQDPRRVHARRRRKIRGSSSSRAARTRAATRSSRQLLLGNPRARAGPTYRVPGGERIGRVARGPRQHHGDRAEERGSISAAGNMRVLAQGSEKRLAKFPDVPTVKEPASMCPSCRQARAWSRRRESRRKTSRSGGFFSQAARTPSWQKYIEDNQSRRVSECRGPREILRRVHRPDARNPEGCRRQDGALTRPMNAPAGVQSRRGNGRSRGRIAVAGGHSRRVRLRARLLIDVAACA